MNRIVIGIMLLVLLVFIIGFSAQRCGSKDEAPEETTEATEETTAASETILEVTEVTQEELPETSGRR